MIKLSKSRFLSGIQCPKKLYYNIHRSDLKPHILSQQQTLFAAGNEIGDLARKLFPGGEDASPSSYKDYFTSIKNTKKWIAEGVPTIYEATFSCSGGFSALDIFHLNQNERWAIEVKSSTSVKDYHILDASFQYWVMSQAGFRPDRIFIMHIDNNYIRDGDIDIAKLFKLEEITAMVISNQEWVISKKDEFIGVLNNPDEPNLGIGKQCNSPYTCEYVSHCWSHLPEKSVFELYNAKGKDWLLYESGIMSMLDIPDDFILTDRQRIQVNGIKKNLSNIDISKINKFISTFQYPLHFFDFETISTSIPLLNGTAPFDQIPFQYSLHITDEYGNVICHHEFLPQADEFRDIKSIQEDPRVKMVKAMMKHFEIQGSIIAYNAPFEISRIKELSIVFPEYKDFLDSLINRFIDLLIPFRNAWYYLPEMGGSASIKSVLPAIAPEFSYKDLEIGHGGLASEIYLSMIKGTFSGNINATRQNLLDYCERDTEGMVVIYRHLNKIIHS